MNRIDELFKNKLANHPVAPSADAWQKVEAGLLKKNSAWVWRLAAALVLFGLVSGAWYLWTKNTEVKPELVQQPVPSQKEIPAIVQPEEQKQNLVAETKTEILSKQNKKSTFIKSEKKKEEPEKVDNVKPEVTIQPEVLITENKTEPTPARKPIVIEFTLDAMPINMTEPAVAVASVDNDKSGLQKILEKARELKNGESELGSLRDAKNELFALDFRKDKTKRN
jgi:outer membrane biosynthesis protein TonB